MSLKDPRHACRSPGHADDDEDGDDAGLRASSRMESATHLQRVNSFVIHLTHINILMHAFF